jgi:amino acid transporter
MTRSKHASPFDIVAQTLARNRLGVPAVVFFVLAAAAPLTVVAGGATTGWAVTGVIGIPIGYVAIAVVLAVFSVGYTAMSRKIVNSGAFYSYIAQGLGRVPGVGAAFVALLGYNTMQIGLYGGFGAVLGGLVKDRLGYDVQWWIWAFVAWAVIAVLGVLRVDINGRVLAVLLVAEIAIAVVYAVVELFHPAGGKVTFDTLAPARLFDGIGAGFATAIAGFVGFEATAVYAEETKDPRRTVPRATYLALVVIGLLYGASSWAMSVATGPHNIVAQAKENSTELMFTLVQPYLNRVWLDIGHILFVTSLFAALLAFHNTVARYSFALGRERVLPAWLGTTGRHNSAPKWGSLTQTMLAAVVLVIYAGFGLDPIVYLFFWLTVLGGLGVLILMTATSAAVIFFFSRYHNRRDVGIWSRFVAPFTAFVALVYVLFLTIDQFAVLLGLPDPHSPWRWMLPASFAAAAGAGMLWAVIIKLTRPEVYASIGLGANRVTTPDVMPVGGVR